MNNMLREFLLDAVQNRVNSLLGSLFMSIRKTFGDNSCYLKKFKIMYKQDTTLQLHESKIFVNATIFW